MDLSTEELIARGFLSPGEVPGPDLAAAGVVEPVFDEPRPAPAAPMTPADLVARAESVHASLVIASPLVEDLDWTSRRPIEFVVRRVLAGSLPAGVHVVVNRQRNVRGANCACARLHVRADTDYVLALRPAATGEAWEIVDEESLPNAWGPVEVAPGGAAMTELASGQRVDLATVSLDWRLR